MDELISKRVAINTTFNMCCRWDGEDRDDLRNMMLTAFQELPTIEPKRGKWTKEGFCSACGEECITEWNEVGGEQLLTPYCPYCGARMDMNDDE